MADELELVYIGNGHYQTIERMPDDSPSGSDYWACYIPSVITKKLGLVPKEHELYILTIRDKAQLAEALKLDITMSGVERMGHFGVVRDWTINLKDGREISLDAEIIKEIVEHENSEHKLDRPMICRDCPTFEQGCEGSNQEDCEGRLDRPDREKIATILKPLTKSYVLSYIHNLNQLETEIKRVEGCYLDQILALIPDIEKAEREKVEVLFADTPSFTTFIRARDGKAGVEECYLIIKSEWPALKHTITRQEAKENK